MKFRFFGLNMVTEISNLMVVLSEDGFVWLNINFLEIILKRLFEQWEKNIEYGAKDWEIISELQPSILVSILFNRFWIINNTYKIYQF